LVTRLNLVGREANERRLTTGAQITNLPYMARIQQLVLASDGNAMGEKREEV